MSSDSSDNSGFSNPLGWVFADSILIFLVALPELGYYTSGKTATAVVTGRTSYLSGGPRGGTSRWVKVDYQFTDATGSSRDGYEVIPFCGNQTEPAIGDSIEIQYIPSKPGVSRFASESRPGFILMFLAVIAGYVIWTLKM